MDAFFSFLDGLGSPFNFVCMVSLFAIACGLIYVCYSAYLNYVLKRDMLRKDMSAEDIERVINAGKGNSENGNQSSEQAPLD